MNSKSLYAWVLPPTWLRFLIIIILVLGVFFRFVNLDRKVYWFDEAFTSLRISGYTEKEAIEQVCDGREINVKELKKYQILTSEKNLNDTLKSLKIEDPQHPPLYYILARLWVQWFGSSVAVTRSLSALISLLAFPCIYWLCLELFNLSLVGWVAIALLAVSPFHVLYAQEARQYSLWTVTILLSSSTLLRAMRLNTTFSWGMYAVTVALGIYTFLFSGLVTIGHGVYVVAIEGVRTSKKVLAYLLVSFLGFVVFTPWLIVTITQSERLHKATAWTSEVKITLLGLMKNWVINLSYFAVDFGYDLGNFNDEPRLKFIAKILIPFILILVGYSFNFLCLKTPKRVWLFVLTLIGVTTLPLAIPDFILGGSRTLAPRYLIPAYLGIQLAVTYLLSTQITATSVKVWRQKLWQLVMVALVSVGILSCIMSSQAESWWLKTLNVYTPQVVRIINQASNPLVIGFCHGTWPIGDELSLSHLLNSKVRFQFMNRSNVLQISHSFSDVFFLYNPTDKPFIKEIRHKLENEQNYKIKEDIYPKKLGLWKLIKN